MLGAYIKMMFTGMADRDYFQARGGDAVQERRTAPALAAGTEAAPPAWPAEWRLRFTD
ncbi:hypothetical protein [Acrocarpospora sp. B8E8]|uniref:hypothetical protein n=1 Tax=Acrocarpospora sp. B8E8 TaxID=3153572 RepID=UPI00325D3A72